MSWAESVCRMRGSCEQISDYWLCFCYSPPRSQLPSLALNQLICKLANIQFTEISFLFHPTAPVRHENWFNYKIKFGSNSKRYLKLIQKSKVLYQGRCCILYFVATSLITIMSSFCNSLIINDKDWECWHNNHINLFSSTAGPI